MTINTLFKVVALALACLIVWGIATEPKRQREREATADITVNGHVAIVYTIVDKKAGKSWRAVVIDRGAVIIPGSEQTLPVEKP